jgi:hypothetical protein
MKTNITGTATEERPVEQEERQTGDYKPKTEAMGSSGNQQIAVSVKKVIEIGAIIIGLILGLIQLGNFFSELIKTQNNMNNTVSNLSTDIRNYQNDNVVIKTQIENWFSRLEIKLESIKDKMKQD